jgi:WD40 repeat protein
MSLLTVDVTSADSRWSLLIDDLVALTLRGDESPVGSWRRLIVKQIMTEKQNEIEKELGEKAAEQIFLEMQRRVMAILSSRQDNRINDSRLSHEDMKPKPIVVKTISPKLEMNFRGHEDEIRKAIFSPDGIKIVTASSDNTAKIWDAKTGHLIRSLGGDRRC